MNLSKAKSKSAKVAGIVEKGGRHLGFSNVHLFEFN